jgi:hypothetical protein
METTDYQVTPTSFPLPNPIYYIEDLIVYWPVIDTKGESKTACQIDTLIFYGG